MSPPTTAQDTDKRCAACLFRLQHEVQSLKEDTSFSGDFEPKDVKDYEHCVDIELLERSSKRGCHMCTHIKTTLVDHYGEGQVDDINWERGGFFVGPTMEPWDAFMLADDDSRDGEEFHGKGEAAQDQTVLHPFLGRFSHPSGDTSSAKALGRFQGWLSRCLEEHTHCGGSDEKPMPHRVVEILDYETAQVRLVDTRGTHGKYACLSHRWCPETMPASLTTRRRLVFEDQIPESSLYPLLREAIAVAGQAGMRFIWIDCLCIIQDDPHDWAVEASTMASIYDNAFLTIASTGCESGSGLFAKDTPYDATEIPVTPEASMCIRPVLNHPLWRTKHRAIEISIDETAYPLVNRGWVYQERALSKRTIHFTRTELVWGCVQDTWCECRSTYPLRPDQRADPSTRTAAIVPSHHPQDAAETSWDKIVARYTQMDLSFAEDRLPALGAMARRYAKYHSLNYVAGLWRETLARDLSSWRLNRHGGTVVRPRPRPLPAPTWSWASVAGHVALDSDAEAEAPGEFLDIVGHEVEPVDGGDVYGRLRVARLAVVGPVVIGVLAEAPPHATGGPGPGNSLAPEAPNQGFMRVGDEVLTFRADYDFTAPGPDRLETGMEVGFLLCHRWRCAHGLVLRCVDGEREGAVYERIGTTGQLMYNEHFGIRTPDVPWCLERAERIRITLV
ncbi:Uu.00g016490.m01.CDS01 [Anthostomella pinea]|uniref:Uu.00g016490.m01.CDS01 n=1 Tax=Anthostomella pinea TaxID=933095 RepID=A0AAI8VZL9_9PEZI|nr:Uu.00g016490.m01.CDS01 [Anthostomella pinea]